MEQLQDYVPGIKKHFGWYTTPLLTGVVISLFAFAFWYGVSGWKALQGLPEIRQMSFSGEGKVASRPDVAVFSVTVVTKAKKVKDAQRENTERSNAILDFLKKEGIAEKDLKTAGYFISPEYSYYRTPPCALTEGELSYPCPVSRPPEIVSYQVRHTLEVKVRNLEKADDLLDGVVTNGANEVGQVDFRIDDEKKLREEARKKAIEDAKGKAAVLAKDLGVRLRKIVAFSESGGEIPIYFRSLEAKGGFGGETPTPAPAPQIEPGEQEVRSTVTITYEFR